MSQDKGQAISFGGSPWLGQRFLSAPRPSVGECTCMSEGSFAGVMVGGSLGLDLDLLASLGLSQSQKAVDQERGKAQPAILEAKRLGSPLESFVRDSAF
mmetsp:Transcript_16120/g.46266  ORF Transcript_16120/g.46266 Transcript_16120/m.46266 type:complete len:99 (+) Transcript_16120:558-854(+)